jgi:hypothetical protein
VRSFARVVSLLLFVLAAQARATTPYAISGQVRDRLTLRAVAGATVFLDEAREAARADTAGRFRIELPKPGTFRVRASAAQYEASPWRVIVVTDESPDPHVQIDLDAQTYRVPTVEIYGERFRPELPQAPTRTLLASDIRRAPGGFQDPLRAIQESRSIESRNDLGTLLTIRGGEPDQILFLCDGVDIYNPYRMRIVLGGGVSLANPDVVESVELYAGGYSARYGNRTSGVIHIKTREGNRLSFRSRATLSLIAASAAIEGPIAGGHGSWLVGGRRTYYDLFIHPPKGEGTQYPFLGEIQGRVDYDPTPAQRLTARASTSDEGVNVIWQGGEDSQDSETRASSRTSTGSLEHTLRINGSLQATTRVSILTDRSRLFLFGVQDSATFADAHSEAWRAGAAHEWELATPPHLTRVGLILDRYRSKVDWEADSDASPTLNPVPDSLNIDDALTYGAAYAEDVVAIHDRWYLSLGVRFEDASGPTPIQASPRASLRGELPYGIRLRVGAGEFLQYADGIQSFSREVPLGLNSLGALPPERAGLVSVGLDGAYKRLTWSVEGYARDTRDLLVPLDRTTYRAEASGRAVARGLESEIGLQSIPRGSRDGHWHEGLEVRLSHAWIDSRFRGGIFDDWTPTGAERVHSFLGRMAFPLSGSVQFSAVLRLASGAPTTPLLARIAHWDSEGHTSYMPVWGEAFSARTPAYQRLDLRVDREVILFGRRGLVFLEVMNATNEKNSQSYQWNSELSHRYPVTGMPILPFLGLSVWS